MTGIELKCSNTGCSYSRREEGHDKPPGTLAALCAIVNNTLPENSMMAAISKLRPVKCPTCQHPLNATPY